MISMSFSFCAAPGWLAWVNVQEQCSYVNTFRLCGAAKDRATFILQRGHTMFAFIGSAVGFIVTLAAGYYLGCNHARFPKLPDWTKQG
jgi:hypothetical protein